MSDTGVVSTNGDTEYTYEEISVDDEDDDVDNLSDASSLSNDENYQNNWIDLLDKAKQDPNQNAVMLISEENANKGVKEKKKRKKKRRKS